MQRVEKMLAQRSHWPPQLQASARRWADCYAKFGGQDAFSHPLRVLDRAIDHDMVELHKIGDRRVDPKQLNLKLANIILGHIFRHGRNNRRDFPSEDFERSQLTMSGFEIFDALRENDLSAMSRARYGELLETPSLGTLARCIDVAQYGPDGLTSEGELANLDPNIFYRFSPYTGKSEYEHIARVARMVYAPLCDLFSYRKLAGDLMQMSYYHLDRGIYDDVNLYLKLLETKIAATQRLMEAVLLQLKERLDSAGYRYDIIFREQKHPGKVMEKVDRYSRGDGLSTETHIESLSDLVAFTVVLHSKKDGNGGKVITQNDLDDFEFVAKSIVEIVSGLKKLRNNNYSASLFTDRITNPKESGYQSYHVDMAFEDHSLVGLEAIVRNTIMHTYAERGGAAHHLFKGGAGLTKTVEKAYRNIKDAIAGGQNPNDTDRSVSYQRIQFVVPGSEPYLRIVPGGASVGEALICGGISLFDRLSIDPPRSIFDQIRGTSELRLVTSGYPLVANEQILRELQMMAINPSTAREIHGLIRELRLTPRSP
ncbi:MAG: hypothetical protein ABH842_01605 [Candidatus Micrarchaeota archaeon]